MIISQLIDPVHGHYHDERVRARALRTMTTFADESSTKVVKWTETNVVRLQQSESRLV